MFKNKLLPILISLIALFLVGSLVVAWEGPTKEPPEGNVPPPLNVSNTGQSKGGGLILNSSEDADVGLIVSGKEFAIEADDPIRTEIYDYSDAAISAENRRSRYGTAIEITGGMLQFSENNEWGDYKKDGGIYWSETAGLYIRSDYDVPNYNSKGRLIWSGENVEAGDGIEIEYDDEDRPTIKADSGEGAVEQYSLGQETIKENCGNSHYCNASCPSNKVLVGGGCFSPDWTIRGSYPNGNTWECRMDGPWNSWTKAYAICVNE